MNSALRCQVVCVIPLGENSGTYDGNLFLDLSFICSPAVGRSAKQSLQKGHIVPLPCRPYLGEGFFVKFAQCVAPGGPHSV